MPVLPSDEILAFWFGGEQDDLNVSATQNSLWWEKNPALDAEVKTRFEPLLVAEVQGEFDGYTSPRELLARIIICDQFPRNMYRGLAQAFAYDERARLLAHELIKAGGDTSLRFIERTFAYLPFEHSEDLNEQHLSVHLYTGLLAEAPAAYKKLFTEHLQFAMRHREIIYQFGRFPHRNEILGRKSTIKELAFLQQPNSSF